MNEIVMTIMVCIVIGGFIVNRTLDKKNARIRELKNEVEKSVKEKECAITDYLKEKKEEDDDRVWVGAYACSATTHEGLYDHEGPLQITVKCEHLLSNDRCLYGGPCDFQDEVTERMAEEHPSLFKKEDNEDQDS